MPLLLLPLLLGVWALVGPASCDPTSTTPPLAGAVRAGRGHPEPSPAAAGAQGGVTLDQIVEGMVSLCQITARAAMTAPLSEVQQQLNAIQADIRRMPKLVLGQPCSRDTDCSRRMSEATCGADGLCSCRDGHRRLSDFECRRNSRLSELCGENADCQAVTWNSRCAGGVYSCGNGFWNYNNTECRLVGAVDEGGACVGDRDCVSSFGRGCVSGTCSCPVKRAGIYEYRLAGAQSCKDGRVELRRNGGAWGLVCDDDWEHTDARVVCRSLGFSSGSATQGSRHGGGKNFYMDDVGCRGSESHLKDCRSRSWGSHNCGASEVAGVICQT